MSQIAAIFRFLPRPLLLIGFLALAVGLYLKWPRDRAEQAQDIRFITFARGHMALYEPYVKEWNTVPENRKVDLRLVEGGGLRQLIMNSMYSGRGFTDMLEVETNMAAQVFSAPIDEIKFRDLSERLEREGLLERINPPSFAPWSRQGRIFGLPKDVHPVLLAYRADLVEEAGLSLEGVETYEDFAERLRPMVQDLNGDGYIDRYLINFGPTMGHGPLSAFLRQADPHLVTSDGVVHINTPRAADIVTRLILWCVGPDRIAGEAPYFSAAGFRLFLEGYVVAIPMADWYAQLFTTYMPALEGKMKLMPLPAWEPGGVRTSAWGGTMLSFYDDGNHFEEAWEFTKSIFFSREMAQIKFRTTGIITPVVEFWDDPVFHEPDPFFSGQPRGQMFIEQAPHVPDRYTSPFMELAFNETLNLMIEVISHANSRRVYDYDALLPRVQRGLDRVQERVNTLMERNPFFP